MKIDAFCHIIPRSSMPKPCSDRFTTADVGVPVRNDPVLPRATPALAGDRGR
jgi:hypothetical protein